MTDYYCVVVGGVPAATYADKTNMLRSLRFFSPHINIRIKKGQREPTQDRGIRQKAQREFCDYQTYPKPMKKGEFTL